MSEVKYAEDRPKDCRYCYYRIRPEEIPHSECDGCPYRQEPKCVSLCMKKILKDWKGKS